MEDLFCPFFPEQRASFLLSTLHSSQGVLKTSSCRDFPSGPVVKELFSNARDVGLIPD